MLLDEPVDDAADRYALISSVFTPPTFARSTDGMKTVLTRAPLG